MAPPEADPGSRRAAGTAAAADPVPPALRVVTLNAHQGLSTSRQRMLTLIRDSLRAVDAHLVFLQEIGGGSPDSQNQWEVLADRVWPQHAYGRNAVSERGHQGNALLSKYPIRAWRNVDVSIGRFEARGLLHCTLDLPDAPPVHAICVHLGLRESHRRRQVERLVQLIHHEVAPADPLIVAGDFNDWRGHAHRRLLDRLMLTEVHAVAYGRPARTFPARWPLLRLDRIYVRHLDHRPLAIPRQPWAVLSDHVPIAAELRLRRA